MRFHRRGKLPPRVLAQLATWQQALDTALTEERAHPPEKPRTEGVIAEQHWSSHRQTRTLDAVTTALTAMASPDVARCMYCEHDRGHQIDHAEPKSRNAARTFAWDNHVWACGNCNLQKLDLYHADMIIPTVDDPLQHLDLTPSGRWEPRDDDSRGRATLDSLPLLNNQTLITARQRCRKSLLHALTTLARQDAPSSEDIERFRQAATQEPFSDVFASLLSLFGLPNAEVFVEPAVLKFVETHAEMHGWLPIADAQRLRDVEPELQRLAKAAKSRTA